MSARGPLALALTAVALAVAIADPARADEKAAVLRVRAAQLAGDGQCAAALPLLARARSLDPEDAAAARLEGRCLFEERRYADAAAALARADRLDPGRGDVALLLGMAWYHAGDIARADASLASAEAIGPPSAELSLYRGLVLLEQARSEEAAAKLARAGLLDPAAVEPAASYYGGLAQAGAGRRDAAEASLERVTQLAPDSEWSRRADEALASSTDPEFALRRWLVLQAGLEYDSNVALRGDDVSLPNDISDKNDGRGVWALDVGGELYRDEVWGAGALARYDGSAHFDVGDFDQHFLTTAVWADRRLGERTFARLQPEFGVGFYDYDDYLRFYGVTGELIHDFGRWGGGRFYTSYSYNDFLFRLLGSGSLKRERDRDGHAVRVGYEHTVALDEKTEIRGGPFYRHYDSRGDEYKHDAVGGWLGVRRALPYLFTLDARGSYDVSFFENRSTFLMADERRRDRKDRFGVAELRLERPITRRVTGTVRWTYQDSDSNTAVFDYDRHIAGAYVTIAFEN